MKRMIFLTSLCICTLFVLNAALAEVTGYGHIKGTILTESGDALSGAKVCLYQVNKGPSPFNREYWRLCDYLTHTNDDGSFSEDFPAGEYYMIATKKLSGEMPGPPIYAGDPTWPAWDGSELKKYVIRKDETTDLGVIPGAVPFKAEWLPAGKTSIEGRVLLEDGTPAEGVLVHASGDPKLRELVFVSDKRTGSDGKYIVRVDEDGFYHLRAKGSDRPIEKATVRSGEITKGIDIRVKENPGRGWNKRKTDK
jgi:hypothetical protein